MREIKFRAWVLESSKFIYKPPVPEFTASWGYRRGEYVLEQYTGLKDKNGKEIYEGDMFKYRDQIVIVEYFEDMFHCKSTKYPNLSPGNYRLNFVARNHEIIGNIHENLELLK